MSLVKDEDIDVDSVSEKWILVRWVGTVPAEAYDIINGTDVVFETETDLESLKVGTHIMVRCGRTKSPAHVVKISDDTDFLVEEMKKLKEQALNKHTITPKIKRRRLAEKIYSEIGTQTEELYDEETVEQLMQENQNLKAELYESNKIINSLCKDLKCLVQGTQKKLQNLHGENTAIKNAENNTLSQASEGDIKSCPVVELKNKVLLGSGRTAIPRHIYNQVNWLSFTAATRKLLMSVFTRDTLATHSLTGKPSPAFISRDTPVKMKLEATKVADIVEVVTSKCNVSESMVRSAITTKCADENKMYRKRVLMNKENKECDD